MSPAIAAVRAYLPKVARSSATVLITGATGSGKEQIAEAIHTLGPRAHGPFVAVNCAALPDTLIESELFGHERGAFTGALASVPGHVARADRGTLFLDEIGEMAAHAQAKLLRVLETHSVQPIGAQRAHVVDIRVVAATNQPLEALVTAGSFRADLYYRLNVARVELPPLKDRREDIPLLLCHIIDQLNQREHCNVGPPDAELLRCVTAHDWPGNVRELKNLVEAIFIDPPRGELGVRHLPPAFQHLFRLHQTTAGTERDRLLSALEQTKWNKAEAAKQLNWSRMTLYRKLSKYHITTSK